MPKEENAKPHPFTCTDEYCIKPDVGVNDLPYFKEIELVKSIHEKPPDDQIVTVNPD